MEYSSSRKRSKLVMANSMCWFGHVLRRAGGYVLRRPLEFKAEDQKKMGRPKRT